MGGINEGGTISKARFCTVCGGGFSLFHFLETKGPLFACNDCHLVYQGFSGFKYLGIPDPKDCLTSRLEALEKKVAGLDREAMMHRPLGPVR